MKLKWIDASALDKNVKATTHRSGKLGFTKEASRKLGLNINAGVYMGINEEDKADADLYGKVTHTPSDMAFRVYKAGDYFYINTKPLFDDLKLNYAKETIVFDIIQESLEGETVFRFRKRQGHNKKQAPIGVEAHH